MVDISSWDWDIGKKQVSDTDTWKDTFSWIEEHCVSPDGEKIAAVVKTDEMEFSVCVNGTAWENGFDKIWNLKFGPDSRLTALVSDTGEWTASNNCGLVLPSEGQVFDISGERTGTDMGTLCGPQASSLLQKFMKNSLLIYLGGGL